ncbi:hypothetical protein ACWFQ8_18215 [Streptomyces sp. NPDC055254]
MLHGQPERACGQGGERVAVLVGEPARQPVLVVGVVGQEQMRVLQRNWRVPPPAPATTRTADGASVGTAILP